MQLLLWLTLAIASPAWAEDSGSLYSAGTSAPAPGMCSRVVYEPCNGAPRKKKRRRPRPVVKVSAPPPAVVEVPAAIVEPTAVTATTPVEIAQPYGSVTDVPGLDFSRMQRSVARRVYGVESPALLAPYPPPVVAASDFGLVVERQFRQEPPRKKR